jgi:imidazolonepropionase-like amidohydrolase
MRFAYAREQLMQGAAQIKLAAGGGVASPFSPLDVSTFTEPELRAAVEAAENWGTYVAVHAYSPVAIQRSIAAGVEEGALADLLLVDGNPIANIKLIEDPTRNFWSS